MTFLNSNTVIVVHLFVLVNEADGTLGVLDVLAFNYDILNVPFNKYVCRGSTKWFLASDCLRFRLAESESRVHKISALICTSFIDNQGNFDFGCSYHLDVDVGIPQELKHFCSDT